MEEIILICEKSQSISLLNADNFRLRLEIAAIKQIAKRHLKK